MRDEGTQNIGEIPCLFSEIGIPFDMDNKAAYTSGDYSSQIRAMDANHYALEGANVGFTLWTYCLTNDHTWGDQWNGEDLSLFSVDDNALSSAEFNPGSKAQSMVEIASVAPTTSSEMTLDPTKKPFITVAGNRAAPAFVRPAPIRIAGVIIKYGFDLAQVTFELTLEATESTKGNAPTEIFVPPLHFPKDQMSVTVSGGKWEYNEPERTLKWWHNEGEQNIKIIGVKMEVENDNLALQLCDKVCTVI